MRTVLLLLTLLTQQVVDFSEGIHGRISGELYRETPHFQIYIEKTYVPVDLDWLEGEVEKIHAYLIERTGVQTSERFAITFRPPDTAPCPLRGLARFDDPGPGQAIIFADQKTTRTQLSGVLAHEIAHLFHARVLKNGTIDMNLIEGFATWEAGKYWQVWQGTPTDNVRVFRREKRYIPLETSYRERPQLVPDSVNCLKARDLRYNSWAAFIDFLISDYGLEKFRQLLGPNQESVSPPQVSEHHFCPGNS